MKRKCCLFVIKRKCDSFLHDYNQSHQFSISNTNRFLLVGFFLDGPQNSQNFSNSSPKIVGLQRCEKLEANRLYEGCLNSRPVIKNFLICFFPDSTCEPWSSDYAGFTFQKWLTLEVNRFGLNTNSVRIQGHCYTH